MFRLNRFYYDNGAADSGGLPPALGDIDDTTTVSTSLGSGEKITNLADVASPLPVTPDPDAPPADKTGDADKQGADADKGDADKGDEGDKSPEGDQPDVTPEDFFGEMEKLSGVKYDIKYPEGMNPLSPEGFVHRDKVVHERAIDDYEAFLKQDDPRAFAYFLHRQAGGSDIDFLGANKGFLLPTSEALAESIDLQKELYKHSLVASGRDPEEAEALVEVAIRNSKLKDRALAAHKAMDDANKADLARIEATTAETARQRQQTETNTRAMVQKSIKAMDNFVVPEAQEADFEKFVWDKLRLSDDGKVLIVQELNPEQVIKQVESLLFQYMKGDLSGVVQKKSRTIAAQYLTKRNTGALKQPSGAQQVADTSKQYLPLTEVD